MTNPADDAALRSHLVELLSGSNAHIAFDDAIKDFPVESAGARPAGSPHSPWELLEHIRIAQADILSFSRGEEYAELNWPDDYWPATAAPASAHDWHASLEAVRNDLKQFISLLEDKQRNLYEPFAWGNGQTLLREALLIADHNSYHLGQFMLLRRILES